MVIISVRAGPYWPLRTFGWQTGVEQLKHRPTDGDAQ